MKRRIIFIIATTLIAAACFAGCGDKKPAETSEESETVAVTETQETVVETEAAETTVIETEAIEETSSNGIPQPGDIYNGHTVDHTEDQPDCDDGSHGTIWVFYTDSEDVDFIEY